MQNIGILKQIAKAPGTAQISVQTAKNKISKGKKNDDKKQN
ncbi:hypothetical protein [Caldicellulosiruptor naganoensis]|uniref:Uncharacterized protein n=1 Tax=Caldicellulosiruptor naganoensis TaxID=29324 RepID=A0ABY7BEJ6_9FIRM|nr:hypothetical protein [Caldicellulosiruptor naganoensis]WAM31240.1 hypothetical protein OTJ99_002075 [Caldicellulosiruptor naganoensis]